MTNDLTHFELFTYDFGLGMDTREVVLHRGSHSV